MTGFDIGGKGPCRCGCAVPDGATGPTAPAAPVRAAAVESPPSALDSAATRWRLERAADGLLYTSESDYPFEYVFLASDARAPLTADAFRTAAGFPPDSAVEERTLDDALARHIERVDPADSAAVALVPRYRALRRTLGTAVRDARVFRVGRVVVRCYFVGVDARGNVVGLATTAIET